VRRTLLFLFVVSLLPGAAVAQNWLPQNWSPEMRQQVYTTAQGSKLIPYKWALALERPDDTTLFFADQGARFGFLPAGNANGLPVGVVQDSDGPNEDGHLGLTCAACHTRDIHYKGTTYRVDGGPADSDLFAFLSEMSRATAATSRSIVDPKFDRFARRVLGENAGPNARQKLFNQLKTFAAGYAKFIETSTPATEWGRSRTDAFGMIFNRVTSIDLGIPSNSRPPNAPVSYPFLWDTSWFNKVQYDGSVPNQSIVDRLGRNVGEVLGVFAEVQIHKIGKLHIMQSTAKRQNLLSIEDWWSELRAPKWSDAAVLPAIDRTKLARGEALYNQHCLSCHSMVTPGVRQEITLVPLSVVGTDEAMTTMAATRMAKTGFLEGARQNFIIGKRFGPTALAGAVTGHVGAAVILTPTARATNPSPNGPARPPQSARSLEATSAAEETQPLTSNDRDDPERARVRAQLASGNDDDVETQLRAFGAKIEQENDTRDYRARPLDGIWATGPFLHNGSVPTLYDLLLAPDQRPKTFFVGDCEIDPVKVGCVSTERPNSFRFDTSIPGNRNTGHTFGAVIDNDADRYALIEYLKSL
jgi:hypothetical protein